MSENRTEERLDAAAALLQFAYWVPNVSGGLVVSTIEQRTDWSYDYNRRLAVLAENNGFDYALSQVRYIASYGPPTSTSRRASRSHCCWPPNGSR